MNQTLLQMLRTLEEQTMEHWPEHIGELVWVYNTTMYSTTGYTPASLMFGRSFRCTTDLFLSKADEGPSTWTT